MKPSFLPPFFTQPQIRTKVVSCVRMEIAKLTCPTKLVCTGVPPPTRLHKLCRRAPLIDIHLSQTHATHETHGFYHHHHPLQRGIKHYNVTSIGSPSKQKNHKAKDFSPQPPAKCCKRFAYLTTAHLHQHRHLVPRHKRHMKLARMKLA